MIRRSGYRFSEKIMLKQKKMERDDDSRKIIPLERLDKLSVSTTSAFDDSSAVLIKKFS